MADNQEILRQIGLVLSGNSPMTTDIIGYLSEFSEGRKILKEYKPEVFALLQRQKRGEPLNENEERQLLQGVFPVLQSFLLPAEAKKIIPDRLQDTAGPGVIERANRTIQTKQQDVHTFAQELTENFILQSGLGAQVKPEEKRHIENIVEENFKKAPMTEREAVRVIDRYLEAQQPELYAQEIQHRRERVRAYQPEQQETNIQENKQEEKEIIELYYTPEVKQSYQRAVQATGEIKKREEVVNVVLDGLSQDIPPAINYDVVEEAVDRGYTVEKATGFGRAIPPTEAIPIITPTSPLPEQRTVAARTVAQAVRDNENNITPQGIETIETFIENGKISLPVAVAAMGQMTKEKFEKIVTDTNAATALFGETLVSSEVFRAIQKHTIDTAPTSAQQMRGAQSLVTAIGKAGEDVVGSVTNAGTPSIPLVPSQTPSAFEIAYFSSRRHLGDQHFPQSFVDLVHKEGKMNLPKTEEELFLVFAVLAKDPNKPLLDQFPKELHEKIHGLFSARPQGKFSMSSISTHFKNNLDIYFAHAQMAAYIAANPRDGLMQLGLQIAFEQGGKRLVRPLLQWATTKAASTAVGRAVASGLLKVGLAGVSGGTSILVTEVLGKVGGAVWNKLKGAFGGLKAAFTGEEQPEDQNNNKLIFFVIVPIVCIVLVLLPLLLSLLPLREIATGTKDAALNQSFSAGDINLGCYKDSTQIVDAAQGILSKLQKGIWGYWNYEPEYPQYAVYSKLGPGETDWYNANIYDLGKQTGPDLFWCTWLVSVAYRIAGAPAPFTAGVSYAFSHWVGQKVGPGDVNALQVPLGSAIFFNKPGETLAHIGLVCGRDITGNNGLDGSITTCESNNSYKNGRYNVFGGKVQDLNLGGGDILSVHSFGLPPNIDPNSPSCAAGATGSSGGVTP